MVTGQQHLHKYNMKNNKDAVTIGRDVLIAPLIEAISIKIDIISSDIRRDEDIAPYIISSSKVNAVALCW